MHDLLAMGERAGALLKSRGEKIVIAETSAGGLVSASLLAVPGASAYYVGGVITYSLDSIKSLVHLDMKELRKQQGIRSSSEPYAEILCRAMLAKHPGVTWGLSETGAAGPPNPYGDPSGHTCMAITGPVNLVRTLRTGKEDRVENMWAFAKATLTLLVEALETAPK